MSNNIGIYCSLSKFEDDAISLKKQENLLMKYKNKEYPSDSFRLYVDKDKSPDYCNNYYLEKLINDIKNKEINLILITSLDRITYKISDMGVLLRFFEEENCNVITVSDNVDFSSEIGIVRKQCILQLSSWYSKSKKEESNRGLVEKVEKDNIL